MEPALRPSMPISQPLMLVGVGILKEWGSIETLRDEVVDFSHTERIIGRMETLNGDELRAQWRKIQKLQSFIDEWVNRLLKDVSIPSRRSDEIAHSQDRHQLPSRFPRR